jgi:TatA/E family protein of Tat protein translocase
LDAPRACLTAFDTVLYDADGRDNGYQELMLSIPHMLVVFVIVLVVFGPQKLPELARSLGKLMAEFRKASADFRGAFEQEMRDMERQVREVERKKAADAAAKAANEEPVQVATFATPAGVETPTAEASSDSSGGDASAGVASGDSAAGTAADAFGEPIDARVTEGAAELVVTPVAEAVARTSPGSGPAQTVTEGTNSNGAVAEAESANTNVNGSGGGSRTAAGSATETGVETTGETTAHVFSIDVPHDQQPT